MQRTQAHTRAPSEAYIRTQEQVYDFIQGYPLERHTLRHAVRAASVAEPSPSTALPPSSPARDPAAEHMSTGVYQESDSDPIVSVPMADELAEEVGGGASSDCDEIGGDLLELPETEQDACMGQSIEWMAGSVYNTYALQLHRDVNLPWTLRSIDGEKWIRVQSRHCQLTLQEGERLTRTCKQCRKLANDTRLRETMERAARDSLSAHTPHRYLNPAQMEQANKKLSRDLKAERLKVRISSEFLRSLFDKIFRFVEPIGVSNGCCIKSR